MMLMLLAFVTGNLVVMVAVIMIWMIATWSTSPAQQLYLVTLVPKSPDIALSVNTSFIQFGFALGSGLGDCVKRNLCIEPKLAQRRYGFPCVTHDHSHGGV